MKWTDPQLERLFKAASQAPDPAPPTGMPFQIQARMMAHLKQAARGKDETRLLKVIQSAVGAAVVIMLIAIVMNYSDIGEKTRHEYTIANSAIMARMAP